MLPTNHPSPHAPHLDPQATQLYFIFFYALLKKDVRETLAHVWFDTAASPYLYQPQIYSLAASLAGEEKILLGSDFPLLKPQRYFKEMSAAGLTAACRKAICGDNAARLLKIH